MMMSAAQMEFAQVLHVTVVIVKEVKQNNVLQVRIQTLIQTVFNGPMFTFNTSNQALDSLCVILKYILMQMISSEHKI